MRHECKQHSMSFSASSSPIARHTSSNRAEDLAVSWPCMTQAFVGLFVGARFAREVGPRAT